MAAAGHRRPPLFLIPLVIVIALLAWWGYTTWLASRATVDGAIEASGTVEAVESQIASVLSGRIEAVEAVEGAEVMEGDLLFRLDDELLKLQIDQAEAGLRAAKAGLSQAKDDDESQAAIAAARARVDQARAAVKMAETQADYANVTAPANGVLTAVSARVGENAAPG